MLFIAGTAAIASLAVLHSDDVSQVRFPRSSNAPSVDHDIRAEIFERRTQVKEELLQMAPASMPRFPTWEMSLFAPEGFEKMRRQLRGATVDRDSGDPEVADLLLRVAHEYARHSFYYEILAEHARPESKRRFDVREYPIERWLTYESSK